MTVEFNFIRERPVSGINPSTYRTVSREKGRTTVNRKVSDLTDENSAKSKSLTYVTKFKVYSMKITPLSIYIYIYTFLSVWACIISVENTAPIYRVIILTTEAVSSFETSVNYHIRRRSNPQQSSF